MGLEPSRASRAVARRMARRAVGAVAPALLRRAQRGRAQARYTRPPQRGPKRILLEATTGCNYRCVMCTDHGPLADKRTPAKLMPWERVDGLLRELAAMGAEQIWLVGRGEPLTHPQAGKIIALATSLGLQSMITTNAGLLSDAFADELCDAGLGTLSISINSGCPETFAHVQGARAEERTRILTLMKRLSQRPRRPWLVASMVLLKPNLSELLAFADEVIAAGAGTIEVLGLRLADLFPTLALDEGEWAQARRDIAEARARAEQAGVVFTTYCIPAEPAPAGGERQAASVDRSHWGLGCFIGYRFVRIDVDGHLHGCCSCENDLGALDDGSFARVWQSPRYERFRRVCRDMPLTRLAPSGCNCRDCGNVPDNEAIHRELHFMPIPATRDGGLATRLDLARIVWDHFGSRLPSGEQGAGFGDLTPEQAGTAWAAVAGLQAAKVVAGLPVPGARPAFMPRQFATRGDAARVLRRVVSILGTAVPQPDQLVAAAAPVLCDPDPVLKSELKRWVRAVRAGVVRAAHAP